MSDALEGQQQAPPTLREQANAPRIGRARFIGNAIGIFLIALVLDGIGMALGLTVPALAGLAQTVELGGKPVPLPGAGLMVAVSVLTTIALGDIAVRRRHDRGHRGFDNLLLLVLVEACGALLVLKVPLGVVPPAVLSGVIGLATIYQLVTLAILPGTNGPNAYGPPPVAH